MLNDVEATQASVLFDSRAVVGDIGDRQARGQSLDNRPDFRLTQLQLRGIYNEPRGRWSHRKRDVEQVAGNDLCGDDHAQGLVVVRVEFGVGEFWDLVFSPVFAHFARKCDRGFFPVVIWRPTPAVGAVVGVGGPNHVGATGKPMFTGQLDERSV